MTTTYGPWHFLPTFEKWQVLTIAANLKRACELAQEASPEKVEETNYEEMARKWLKEIRAIPLGR